MKATLKQVQGTTFAAKSDSNHWVTIDNSSKEDGSEGASGPMEFVLMGLGGCSAVDVYLILKKMRAELTDLQVNLDAERAEDPPRVFTKVNLEFVLTGRNLKPADVQRAIKLSMDKYCSVAGMISKTAQLEISYKIHASAVR
ncbi:OsmC family protein [bacterium]|nr:OsmC family protein [bacterium]